MELHEFEEYIRYTEPEKRKKGEAWQVAIGLQAVDRLVPSSYLLETAQRDIEGEISIHEVESLMKTYYQSKSLRSEIETDEFEADVASVNIRKLLDEPTCAFSFAGLTAIHRRIFTGVFKFAGQIRTYNITKKEWVLRGDTVRYVSAPDIRAAVEYDLDKEKRFNYVALQHDEIITHLAEFVSGLWQIHPFGEGNTRTTAVFTIMYLRSLGFHVENDSFVHDSWYFRNALVRANFQDLQKGVVRDMSFLVRFFRNLLLGENHELRNREMVINLPENKVDKEIIPQVTPQAPLLTPQVTPQVKLLVQKLGRQELSVKEMMLLMGLKDRKNFINLYLVPSLTMEYIRYLYPDKPKHPRQKYLLTVKGLMLFSEIKSL